MAKLIAIQGPRQGREYTLGQATIFGRRLDTDIRVPDPTVSRLHAKITDTNNGFAVVDLKSGNGTIVNDRLITRTTFLKHGDRIRIGDSVFVFCESDEDIQTLGDSSVSLVETAAKTESTILAIVDPDDLPGPGSPLAKTDLLKPGALQGRLKQVLEISESMQSILELRQLLPQILDDLFRIFPTADRGLIMLRNPVDHELVPTVAKSREAAEEGQMLFSKTIVNTVREGLKSILSADAMSDERFRTRQSVAALQVRSVMCVPLIRDEEFLGLIYLDTSHWAAKFSADDLKLLTGVAAQAALAIQNARMHDTLLKRQRIEKDMQLAQDVQKGFLPDSVPQVPGFEFCAWYGAALEVGGDFYDFIERPDGRLCIVIGDVAGKGLPAALMMAKLMGDVRFCALSDQEPEKVLARLNRQMAANRAAQGRFVTLLYILLDPNEKCIWITNAGHPPPMLKRQAGRIEPIDQTISLPLGVSEDAQFRQEICRLNRGDTLAIFTDGVTEAMNMSKKQFGLDRLQRAMERSPSAPKAMLEQILADVNDFVGLASPSDDLTLVCFGPAE